MPRISQYYDEETVLDPIQDMIWRAGIKATAPRMAVVKALQNEKLPISIAQLYKGLKEVSETSIYRTLEALVHAGTVSRIDTGAAHSLYELTYDRPHHHHVICRKCAKIEDVEAARNCPGLKLGYAALSKSESFSSISGHSLELFGICKDCA